jgi:hypothetical protein
MDRTVERLLRYQSAARVVEPVIPAATHRPPTGSPSSVKSCPKPSLLLLDDVRAGMRGRDSWNTWREVVALRSTYEAGCY